MDLSQTQPLERDDIPETVKSNPEEQVACLRMLSQKGLVAKCLPVFGEKNVIGSNKDVCHIHIPSRAVSNRHAVIDVDGHTHLIYDLHSLNHTYRGKMFLRPDVRYEIRDKDLLSFADIICQYFIDHKHEEGCGMDKDIKRNDNTAVNQLPIEEDKPTTTSSEKTNAHVLSDSEPEESSNHQPVVEKSKTYSVLETPCTKMTTRKSRTEGAREKRTIEDSHSEIADTDSNTRDDVLDQSEEESRTDGTRKSGGETFNWANMQTQIAVLPGSDSSDKEDHPNGECLDPLAPTQLFAASNPVSETKQCDYDAPTQLFDNIPDNCRKDGIPSNAGKKVTENSNIVESDEEEDMLQDLNVRNERARSDEICKNIENEIRSAIEDENEFWAQLETQDLNSNKSLAKKNEANIATQKLDSPRTTPEKKVADRFEAPTQLIALPGEDNNNTKSRKPGSSPTEIRRSSRVPKKKKVWDGDGEESGSSCTSTSNASNAAKKNADGLPLSVPARSESRSVSFGETSGDRTADSSTGESSGISRKRVLDSKGESDEESYGDLVIDTEARPGRIAKVAPAKRKRAVNDEEFTRPKTLTRVRKAKANFPDDSEWISPKKRPNNATPSPGNKSLQEVPKVMFTGLSDVKWTKVIKALGGEITESVFDCSILVTDKIRRTCKLLCSIARGKHIVSQKWLQECEKSQKFIDSTPFLVKDVAAEEKYGFALSESIKKAAQKPLLDGYTVHATAGVTPDPEDIKTIVECSGGQYSSRMPSSTRVKKNSFVISVLDNEQLYRSAQAAGVPVVATELLLSGVLRQKLDFKKYMLPPPSAEAETSRTRKARK